MKTKISPAIVGAFVIGAFGLGLVALLTFGGMNFFSKPQRFVAHFDESIHGLDQGSPLKLRGLRVGRVVALNMRYDEARSRSIAAVVCELNRDAITDHEGKVINVADRAELENLVRKGLRAQLQVQALATGLLFIELNFFDPKEEPGATYFADPRYVVVPTVTSAISEFQASLSGILANLQKTDFAALSRNLNGMITEARDQIKGLDLKGTVDQWKKTGAQVEALVANPEFKRTFENVNGAVTELRATVAKLAGQIDPLSTDVKATLAEVRKTVQSFDATAADARRFIAENGDLGGELVNTLQHLNETVDAVKRLVDFLERNPNALITGRKRPE